VRRVVISRVTGRARLAERDEEALVKESVDLDGM